MLFFTLYQHIYIKGPWKFKSCEIVFSWLDINIS